MGPYLFMTYKGFSAAHAGQFFGIIYGIGGLSSVVLVIRGSFWPQTNDRILGELKHPLCYTYLSLYSQSSEVLLYFVGGLMGIGLHAIYVLGYTIGQDGVKPHQIGLATGIVGASSYFLSFFSGPLMGYLTKAYGYLAALDIVVVAFEAILVVIAIVMVETQKKKFGATKCIASSLFKMKVNDVGCLTTSFYNCVCINRVYPIDTY